MFAHQRKRVQILFAIADALLTLLAFEAAYWTRTQLSLDRVFFLHTRPHILLAVVSVLIWIGLGSQQRVYEYLDSAKPARVLSDTLRQCVIGTVLLVVFQYLMRLDPPLSRSFLCLFFGYAFVFLAIFRLQAPRLVGAFYREFGTPYHVVLVGEPDKTERLEAQLALGSPFRIQISAKVR
ncbi:MAG: hypothetical protein JO061_15530, partial [Acidobacteriaceae bacterium]|nr:hypothetical protein [Acidobacteriaceae bacterium]